MEHSKNSSMREVYSHKSLPQETKQKKKTQTNNLTLHLKQLEKEEKSKTQS